MLNQRINRPQASQSTRKRFHEVLDRECPIPGNADNSEIAFDALVRVIDRRDPLFRNQGLAGGHRMPGKHVNSILIRV